jgi:hypothetical protein
MKFYDDDDDDGDGPTEYYDNRPVKGKKIAAIKMVFKILLDMQQHKTEEFKGITTGSEGTRRVRSLRKKLRLKGYTIETKKIKDSYQFSYQLRALADHSLKDLTFELIYPKR